MLELLTNALFSLVRRGNRSEAGQSTAEYALVMLVAAAIAGVVLTMVKHTNIIGSLFGTVVHGLLHF